MIMFIANTIFSIIFWPAVHEFHIYEIAFSSPLYYATENIVIAIEDVLENVQDSCEER